MPILSSRGSPHSFRALRCWRLCSDWAGFTVLLSLFLPPSFFPSLYLWFLRVLLRTQSGQPPAAGRAAGTAGLPSSGSVWLRRCTSCPPRRQTADTARPYTPSGTNTAGSAHRCRRSDTGAACRHTHSLWKQEWEREKSQLLIWQKSCTYISNTFYYILQSVMYVQYVNVNVCFMCWYLESLIPMLSVLYVW